MYCMERGGFSFPSGSRGCQADGRGACSFMDDANVPSLLALPYTDPEGRHLAPELYERTRDLVLSPANPWPANR